MKRPAALAFAVLFASSLLSAQLSAPLLTAEAFGESYTVQIDTSHRPFIWPVPDSNRISSGFPDVRNGGTSIHASIDIPAPLGTEILASATGTVVDTKDGCEHNYPSFCGCNGSCGNRVCIQHEIEGVTYWTVYMHMTDIYVNVGDIVEQGAVIGTVGSTGNSTGNHLDFSIRTHQLWTRNLDEKCDPCYYIQLPDTLIFAGSCDCCAEWLEHAAYGLEPIVPVLPVTVTPSAPVQTSQPATTEAAQAASSSASTAAESVDITEIMTAECIQEPEAQLASSLLPTPMPVGAAVSAVITESTETEAAANAVKIDSAVTPVPAPKSEITVTNATKPTGIRTYGKGFGVHGEIHSQYPLRRVWGGVYYPDGTPTAQYCDVNPDSCEYDLRTYIDNHVIFGELAEGSYLFRMEAEDEMGYAIVVAESEFSIAKIPTTIAEAKPEQKAFPAGDVNRDGSFTVADSVMIARIVAEDTALQISSDSIAAADADGDGELTASDITYTLKLLSETGVDAA